MRISARVLGLSLAILAPLQAEVLVNGSFEAGGTPPNGWSFDMAGWSPNFIGALDTGDGGSGVWNAGSNKDGANSAHKSFGGNLAGSYWIHQTFPTTVGVQYTLTGWYAGGVGGGAVVQRDRLVGGWRVPRGVQCGHRRWRSQPDRQD